MKLPNRIYDILKWLVLVCIPAATVLYTVLDKTFGWGYAETVMTISSAVCTFIGALIGVSTAEHNKDIRGY